MQSALLEEWKARGLVEQATESGLGAALDGGHLTAYIGFDPTAPSLHVGSLLPVTMLMRLQRAGHRPIAVVGGGTGMVGDPAGKDSERSMLSLERLEENVAGLRHQLERFLDFSAAGGAVLVNNLDWLGGLDLLGFLRDVGKHFSVNAMITRENVRRRLEEREHGISYTEFSYLLLQAYDYLELYDRYGCTLQLGGNDQWGNIVSGTDLIRRLRGAEAHGLTMPLITRADGKKLGKSEAGNVWLDAGRTAPFDFYQFWLNTGDDDVLRFLRLFTFLAAEEIDELARAVAERAAERDAQRRLAAEMTVLVHGAGELERCLVISRVLFAGGDLAELSGRELEVAFRAAPSTAVPAEQLRQGLPLVEALVLAGLSPSKSQARQAIASGAVAVGQIVERDVGRRLGEADVLADRFVILRRGKKTYHLLSVASG